MLKAYFKRLEAKLENEDFVAQGIATEEDVFEFIRAVNLYKVHNNVRWPSLRELFEIMMILGYRKTTYFGHYNMNEIRFRSDVKVNGNGTSK